MPAAGCITLQRGLTRTAGQRAGVPSRVRRARRLRRRGAMTLRGGVLIEAADVCDVRIWLQAASDPTATFGLSNPKPKSGRSVCPEAIREPRLPRLSPSNWSANPLLASPSEENGAYCRVTCIHIPAITPKMDWHGVVR